nr:FCD domain-containing protein [Sphingobium sp. Sx8-8]
MPVTIAKELGRSIVSGQMAPGTLLGGEVEASRHYGVSRTVYREAVRILGAKGLVDARPRFGTRISDPSKWELLDTDVLSWIFSDTPDPALIAGIFELRRIIEPAAAALAATRRTFTQLGMMETALGSMEALTLATEAGRAADARFHSTMIDACGNPFLSSLSEGICAAVSLATIFRLQQAAATRDPVPDHWRVFRAIAASDADAAREAMLALIDNTLMDTTMVSARSSRGVAPAE